MQVLKDEIRERIIAAALEKFAERGFIETSMADIAKKAGLSVGNLYLYYQNKNELFDSIIPDSLLERLKTQLNRRIAFANGKMLSNVRENPAYILIGEEMIEFYCQYRWQILIILGKAENTPYAGVKDEIIQSLSDMFFQYYGSVEGIHEPEATEALGELIPIIYSSLISSLLRVLTINPSKAQIRSKLERLIDYHLFGLNGFIK